MPSVLEIRPAHCLSLGQRFGQPTAILRDPKLTENYASTTIPKI